MIDSTRLSHYDVSFLAPMVDAALADQGAALHGPMKVGHGDGWIQEARTAGAAHREMVELVMRETRETSEALAKVDQAMGQISSWRRYLEALAWRAPRDRQRSLLRAAGYGLGSPRSVKEAKDFCLEVKSSVGLYIDELKAAGAPDIVLNFPSATLAALEAVTGDVAKERAEDRQARDRVQATRAKLDAIYRDVDLSLRGELALAEFTGDEAKATALRDLETRLLAARDEARVRAQKRASEAPVPHVLTGAVSEPEPPANADG